MGVEARPLREDELDEAWALGLLAFGADPATPRRDAPGRQQWGLLEDGQLLAKATVLPFAQWFGGRPVPMAGLAGVATRPEARGRGLVRRLVAALLPSLGEQGLPISALFATAPGIYRALGWEVAGTLQETRLDVADLGRLPPAGEVRLRRAGADDAPALQALWDRHGATGNGALTRTGPLHPRGAGAVALEADVVTLAEHGSGPVGYVSYDRGRGYGADACLRVRELVAQTPEAHRALLGSLAGWDAVVGTVQWRGPTDDLAVLLGRAVPPPFEAKPWSLRVVDPVAAVAARGWLGEVDAAFRLVGPDGAERSCRLVVESGEGRLEPTGTTGLPRLHARGLALLYAGAARTARLQRLGLLDGPLPGLDGAFSGPRPTLHDYF